MRTTLEIREQIETVLSDLLGTYTYSNQTTTPAICVLPDRLYGWDFPPTGTKVSGLEVVVIPDAKITHKNLIRGNLLTHHFQIILKQWDSTNTTIEATLRLVNQIREPMNVKPRIIPNNNLENIESQVILIVSPVAVDF